MMNIKQIILPILFFGILVGCNKSHQISILIDGYDVSGKTEDAFVAINTLNLTLNGGGIVKREHLNDKEIKQLTRLSQIAFENKHFDVFFAARIVQIQHLSDSDYMDIYDPYGFTQKEYEMLNSEYSGSNAEIFQLLGKWHLRNGRIASAYNQFVRSAVIDDQYADGVKYLLQHYGCLQTASVWAELSANNYTMMSVYDPGGEKYPEIVSPALPLDQLSKLRKDLRKGTAPAIQENCPINLYE